MIAISVYKFCSFEALSPTVVTDLKKNQLTDTRCCGGSCGCRASCGPSPLRNRIGRRLRIRAITAKLAAPTAIFPKRETLACCPHVLT